MESTTYEDLKSALIEDYEEAAGNTSLKYLVDGEPPTCILNKELLSGMDVVGEKFQNFEMYLPEVLQSAAAMKALIIMLCDAVKIIRLREPEAKIMAGGALLATEYAREVGSDGLTPDSPGAVNLAKNLIGE